MSTRSTRNRLIFHADTLFRQKGYHGVGLTEILTAAKAPKGSLYHHFPNGKSDLALAAADWAAIGMTRIIDESFADANSYHEGQTTLCYKLAQLFDLSAEWDGCPVTSILFRGPQEDGFRERAAAIFDMWIETIGEHGVALREDRGRAHEQAATLLLLLQGAWVMARAQKNSDIIRALPQRVRR